MVIPKDKLLHIALGKLLGHEGDFSDHKDDPGGATRYGITEAVARYTANFTPPAQAFPTS